MSYKIKTLIVFDTNSLRSTDAGEVAYSFFAFGRPYQVIDNFITDNNLSDDIHIAIPAWVIEELKDQKSRQYKEDVDGYLKIANRLMGLPGFGRFSLPDNNFDCKQYIEERALEYIAQKSIKLLDIKEEVANTVLRSMMIRVMRDENKKQPFAHSGKYKDAGFKDNVVWESLMHFEDITNYDKVIFLTKDGDYKNCELEFREKWERHISILKDENNVIVDIKRDYENYIKERAIHDYAQTEYFLSYLNEILKDKVLIIIDEIEQPIRSYAIEDACQNVSRLQVDEQGVVSLLISSKIKITYKWDDETKEQIIEALTMLYDDETKEIISTEFDFELV